MFYDIIEMGIIPRSVVRAALRLYLRHRLDEERKTNTAIKANWLDGFIGEMDRSPLVSSQAMSSVAWRDFPVDFLKLFFGPRLVHTCCYWGQGIDDISRAEVDALSLACSRAGIEDGMRILDFGCAFGPMTFWLAERYPNSLITAMTPSFSCANYVQAVSNEHGFRNIEVVTASPTEYRPQRPFDMIIALESLGYILNYRECFRLFASWLHDRGSLFIQQYCHGDYAYQIGRGSNDWMDRYFFKGGIMPSDSLVLYFQEHLHIAGHWRLNGRHYQETAGAWLDRLDSGSTQALSVLRTTQSDGVTQWINRWALFLITCMEVFRSGYGNEWWISHYLFDKH